MPKPKLSRKRIVELAELAKKIDRDESVTIKAKGKAIFARHEAMQRIIAKLKSARQEQGLSLAEVGDRSGIGKANVSRLENDLSPNPTWDTIARYAESVGRRLKVTLG